MMQQSAWRYRVLVLLLILGLLLGCAACGRQDPKEPEKPGSSETPKNPEPPDNPDNPAPAFIPRELLSGLPYTGDLSACTLTAAQADAFAQVLEDCVEESVREQEEWYEDFPPFCRSALFDAGDGIPALWVVEGSHLYEGTEWGYMPTISRIYCLEGDSAVPSLDTSEQEANNFLVTPLGFVLDRFSPEWIWCEYGCAEVYPLSGGHVGDRPVHIYEHFGLVQSGEPSVEELRALTERYGSGTYDFGTLSPDRWTAPEYEGECWMIAAFDGAFLSLEEAAESGKDVFWMGGQWLLGHGQAGHLDVDWHWEGAWGDAAETANLLRAAAEG